MTAPPDKQAVLGYLATLTPQELEATLAEARGTDDQHDVDALAVLGFKHHETEDN